ncbi:MAG: lamin tail domain-containing protein, partial [Verrucomicrobia bacterium]|nr:lamin tail domain-containing protein [Verrucomicrobiota bacterium]
MLKFFRLAACSAIALLSHPPAQGGLVINEIMANNESGVPADGGYPDWVEIYNTGPGSVNLQGHTLTDNLTTPNKFTFTQSHTLAAGQFLVVWCSGNATLGSLHAPFSLSDSGEEVGLFGPGGNRLDSVKFGLQPPNYSISRFPDGTGTWSLSAFTPGASNEVQPLGNPRRVVINEWMASPASGDDWIELYNPEVLPVSISGFYMSDATVSPATNRPLRALSFMAAEGYLQLFASGLAKTDGDHLDFRLNNSGETLSILTDDARTVSHRMTYGRQEANTSQGRLPDGADNIQSFPVGKPTPAASNFVPITDVWINEVLAHTDPPFEDAVELYNPTSLPVNISYWWLSNAKGEPKKYRFPKNSIIQPNSYWVVYQQQFDAGNPRVPFRFNSARGDECYLFSGDSAERL